MKVALTLVAVFAVAVTGVLGYKHLKSPTSPTAQTDSVSVSTNNLPGNVADISSSPALNKTNKIVQRISTQRVVYFNDQFHVDSVQQAIAKLKDLEAKSNEPIYLLIDSPGGSVIDGGSLASQMEASKAPVYTVCTRLCASMAAITHSYGAKRYALDRAILMYHPASGGARGQVPNMVSLLKTISRYVDRMNANIVSRSNGKLSKADFETLVAYELWIDSEDALEKGLIDGIVSLNVPMYESSSGQAEETDGKVKTPTPRKIDIQMISPYAEELWGHNKNGQR